MPVAELLQLGVQNIPKQMHHRGLVVVLALFLSDVLAFWQMHTASQACLMVTRETPLSIHNATMDNNGGSWDGLFPRKKGASWIHFYLVRPKLPRLERKAKVDSADRDRWTPLICAARAGHEPLVESLGRSSWCGGIKELHKPKVD